MKVRNLSSGNASRAQPGKAGKASKAGASRSARSGAGAKSARGASSAQDSVKLSGARRQMEILKGGLDEAGDMTAERISALKSAIEAGQYQPDAYEVAEAIIHYVQSYYQDT